MSESLIATNTKERNRLVQLVDKYEACPSGQEELLH